MNANQELWEKGDFTRIAATMRESGEELVDSLGIEAGMAVLDLGCGDGTTALPAAKRGADVLGVDVATNLVAAGNARAQEAGLGNVSFQQGDASDLAGLEDGRFDLSLSVFGAMFAPDPYNVAKEMVRVTKPGGRVVMGNWIPGDPTLVAKILSVAAVYAPPPPAGFVSPMSWGVEDEVTDRFGAAGVPADAVSFERATWVFRSDGAPEEMVANFLDFYGPTMNAFAAAAADGREAQMRAELDALFASQNRADDGTTEIPATFLLVSVAKP
jgi:SAM-dependent methyltransferase